MTDPNAVTSVTTCQITKLPLKQNNKRTSNANKLSTGRNTHPKYSAMIKQALTQLNERIGVSKAAILKYILSNFKVNPATANQHLKLALRAGTKNHTLKQTKGIGVNGRFKLPVSKPAKLAKTSASKPKATGTKRKRSPSPAKTTSVKKPAISATVSAVPSKTKAAASKTKSTGKVKSPKAKLASTRKPTTSRTSRSKSSKSSAGNSSSTVASATKKPTKTKSKPTGKTSPAKKRK